jgi:hypothetical protein
MRQELVDYARWTGASTGRVLQLGRWPGLPCIGMFADFTLPGPYIVWMAMERHGLWPVPIPCEATVAPEVIEDE